MNSPNYINPSPELAIEVDILKPIFSKFLKEIKDLEIDRRSEGDIIQKLRGPLSEFDNYVQNKATEGTHLSMSIAHEFRYFIGNLLGITQENPEDISISEVVSRAANKTILGVLADLVPVSEEPLSAKLEDIKIFHF